MRFAVTAAAVALFERSGTADGGGGGGGGGGIEDGLEQMVAAAREEVRGQGSVFTFLSFLFFFFLIIAAEKVVFVARHSISQHL